ncbi:hypothetical protein CR152_24955 [Massilia violaceinigra]|uniref:Uncharacterized protein n=1 Tax=Massilia violaceinigra TaxID=2045208 RepID=A0A2D2DQW7_9BURK|nr:hypothetical protein CR152_24955 [Massilia violaceinigra]
MLTACGGGGGGGGSGSQLAGNGPVTVAPDTARIGRGPNILFVSDRNNQVIAAFDTLAPAAANTAVSANVLSAERYYGYSTQLDAARDLLYIMAGDQAGAQIGVLADASKLSGKMTPQRYITPEIGASYVVQSLILDKTNDRMYVGYKETNRGATGFMVLERVSTLSGRVAPARTFTGPMDTMQSAIDTKRGLLYTKHSHASGQPVYVFENIDKASGELPIARRFNLPGDIVGLAIDEDRDRLYAGSNMRGLAVFADVSKPDPASRVKLITLPRWTIDGVLAFDRAHDRLYAGMGSTAYVVERASKLGEDGQAAPLSINAGSLAVISGFAF